MPISSPQSVLIIRLDAIGDALALTPLLRALSDRAIAVDLVMTDRNAEIFTPRAARQVHISPFALRSSTPETLATIRAFGRELAAQHYDCVLVATEDPGGYRLASAVGAPIRAGFANGWGKPLKTLWVRKHLTRTVFRSAGLSPQKKHECEVIWSLAQPWLDGEPPYDATRLSPLILRDAQPKDGRILLQATSKWERLEIRFDDVATLVAELLSRPNFSLIASTEEASFAQRLAAATQAPLQLCEDLRPWKAAIARASAIIAPDSGAVHLAGMLGTPVIAVFPPIAEFDSQIARWYPWAAPYEIICAMGEWPTLAAKALYHVVADTAK
ncbi:MAG: glycosyltransferase family 9 protein [Vulcanimicrobiaceae bacterium]